MTKTLVDRLDVNEEDILVETEADTTTLQTAALSIEILTRFLASSTEYADAFVEMVPAILAPLTRRIALRKQGKVSWRFYSKLIIARNSSILTSSLL